MKKSKFFNKRGKKTNKPKKLYAQALASSVGKILKLKKNFPSLFAKKIKNIHRIINDFEKIKPKINITTRGPLRKQVIVLIGNDINRCFNIGSYITTICSTNMNLGVSQCKNYWK